MAARWKVRATAISSYPNRRNIAMKSVVLLVLLLMALVQPVVALDPESVKGPLKVNQETIQLSKAYAHLHDNAEGLLERPKELRILLVDRAVPPGALTGIAWLPALEMAREGKLRGLLLQLDPDDRRNLEITLLYPPAASGHALMTQTLSDTAKDIVQKLEIGAQSVTGEIEHGAQNATTSKETPKLTYALQFNARLSKEPRVSSDLKGKAAENSPQVKVLREKARALAKLDIEALRKVCTERVNRQNDELRTKAGSRFKVLFDEAAGDLEVALESVERVVVRGDRAVVISSNQEWSNLVREGKVWKSDD
jgi:hypothetical protein